MSFFRFLIVVLTLLACNNSEISLSKLNNSPKAFNNSKLILKEYTFDNENNYLFDFEVSDFSLGTQTRKHFNFDIANSTKGQHIHLIVNNGPYFAKYSNSFKQKLKHQKNPIIFFQKQNLYIHLLVYYKKVIQYLNQIFYYQFVLMNTLFRS